MESQDHDGPPQKRVRLSPGPADEHSQPFNNGELTIPAEMSSAGPQMPEKMLQDPKEVAVGITAFANPNLVPFHGTLKKRYTDFLVNEILPSGEVVHLQNTRVLREASLKSREVEGEDRSQNGPASNGSTVTPANSRQEPDLAHEAPVVAPPHKKENGHDNKGNDQISAEDKQKLVEYFNAEAVEQLLALYTSISADPEKKVKDHGSVKTEFTSDRTIRPQIHQDIRRIFERKIDSSTDREGFLILSAANTNSRWQQSQRAQGPKQVRPGKLGWLDRGGEYLHFTLYKENKDTMEVISFLTRQMKMNTKAFQFAGTKDRRAVTAQRVSVYRVDAERVAGQNRMLRNAAVGDFVYQPHGLELGDLNGNEFVITLRDCHFPRSTESSLEETMTNMKDAVSKALDSLRNQGFLNYYGLQRFGTYATRTDTIGVKLLRGDFRGACDAILDYSPEALSAAQDPDSTEMVGQDDKARAEAIHNWKVTGDLGEALDKMPRKFSAESALLRQLTKNPHDHLGALLMIQRNLRLMYVHAYQSLVWNLAVGKRWSVYGSEVVEGDLVLVNEHKEKASESKAEEVDADGEVVIQPASDDRAQGADDIFERARALTAIEAQSGKYTIFDVVLPQPGYDILYPQNESGTFYQTFMSSEEGGGLDPYDMRRKQKDFSLSGGYRKMLARIEGQYDVQVRSYSEDDRQFVKTDLDRIEGDGQVAGGNVPTESAGASLASEPKIAVILKFQLGASQYATMALREISKGGIQAHKPDFAAGR